MRRLRVRYGRSPHHFGDLRLPAGPGPHPLVVTVHGGFWSEPYDLDSLRRLCEALGVAGYATWNVEYRRLGHRSGGYPVTHDDVRRALEMTPRLPRVASLDLDRVIVVGHSAGAQLALCLASGSAKAATAVRLAGVISLAGVTDMIGGFTSGLAGGIVGIYLGGAPEDVPRRYADASPLHRLPLGLPHVVLHGDRDVHVPPTMSSAYAAKARAAGDDVHHIPLDGVDHFDLIDPESRAWPHVLAAVASLLPASVSLRARTLKGAR